MGDEINYQAIADMLRTAIEGQVATTASGKLLTSIDDAAVRNLITNIVGNLTYTVASMIEDATTKEIRQ